MRRRIIGAALAGVVGLTGAASIVPAHASVTPRPPCDDYQPGGVRFPTTTCMTTYLYMYGLKWKYIGSRSAVARVRKIRAEGYMRTAHHARVRFSDPRGYDFPDKRDHLIYCVARYRNADGDLAYEDLCLGLGV